MQDHFCESAVITRAQCEALNYAAVLKLEPRAGYVYCENEGASVPQPGNSAMQRKSVISLSAWMRLKRGAKCVGRVSIMKPRVSVNRSKKGNPSFFFQRRVNKKLYYRRLPRCLYFRRERYSIGLDKADGWMDGQTATCPREQWRTSDLRVLY